MRRSLPVRRDVRDFLEGAGVGPQRWIPCSSARAACAVGAHAGCAWTAQAALRPLKLAVHAYGLPGLRSGCAQAALRLRSGCSGSLVVHGLLRQRSGCSGLVCSGCAQATPPGCACGGLRFCCASAALRLMFKLCALRVRRLDARRLLSLRVPGYSIYGTQLCFQDSTEED